MHPQTESYWGNVNPVGPRAVYDEAKRYAEALVAAYRRTHGLPMRIVRIFNTYGPRMRLDDGRVVPAFVAQALARRGLHRLRRREARPAASATSSTWSTASSGSRSPTCEDPVNLGNPEEMTILEFAEAVRGPPGPEEGASFTARSPRTIPQRRRPDITPRAAAARLGAAEPPLDEGLRQTIAYFRAHPGQWPSRGSGELEAP